MSAAGAVQMGSAFVRFFGQANELYGLMKNIGSELKSFASSVSAETSQELTGGFSQASHAAVDFGTQTQSASHVAANSMQTVAVGAVSVTDRLRGMAVASGGAIAGLLKVPPIFTAFRAGAGAISFLVGNIGQIGRAATLASWGLKAVSFGMRAAGKDTTQIDKISASLGKVGRYAMIASIGIKAMMLPFRALSGTVGLVGKLASSVGGLAGRAVRGVGRFGGIASMGAMAAGSIESGVADGTEEGEKKSGGFMRSLAPILTGLAIAGPIGAAATAIGVFIAGAFSKGGESGSGFFSELSNRASAWTAWFGGMWQQVSARVTGIFGGMASSGESFLSKVEKALIPLTYAIQNVWLPAFINAIDYVGSFFKKRTTEMSGGWSAWILDAVSALAEFVGNIDLYFQIAQQTLVMWAGNAILQVGDFFTNVGIWLDWFSKNWFNVLTDAFNLERTIFTNMVKNIGELFSKLWEWVTNGFQGSLDIDFKPLTEGFKSSIQEWPKLTKTELESLSPELQALYKDLGARQAKAAAEGQKIAAVEQVNKAAAPYQEQKGGKEYDTKFSAISARSQEAYSALARLQNSQMGSTKPELVEAKKQTAELKEIKIGIKDVVKIGKDGPSMKSWELPP